MVQSTEASARKKNGGLGRGLGALIPEGTGGKDNQNSDKNGVRNISLSAIVASSAQPRTEFAPQALNDLAASIREHGVLQPILVRPSKDGFHYEIIAGERRFRAAQKANLTNMPCLVSNISDEKALPIAMVENLQREDLNAIEEARGYLRLSDEQGLTQEEIAKIVGKDRATIANAMRLLKLPTMVQEMLAEGSLSMGHARALLAVKIPALIEELAYVVVDEGMSVRDVESLAQRKAQDLLAKKPGSVAPSASTAKKVSAVEKEIRKQLERSLGTRVDFNHSGGKGSIVVHFSSTDQLNDLLAMLKVVV